jgi:DNA-binding NarL/FixJ family response regulator
VQPRTVFLVLSEELGWGPVRQALEALPEARIVGTATGLDDAAAEIPTGRPDVILTAATVEGASAAPLLRHLRYRSALPGRIALFAPAFTPALVAEFADLAIAGYLAWPDLNARTLAPCLTLLLNCGLLVSSAQAACAHQSAESRLPRHPHADIALTARECAVLQALAAGMTQDEAAATTGLSLRTLKRTVAGLQRKLEAPCPVILGMRIRELGLVA